MRGFCFSGLPSPLHAIQARTDSPTRARGEDAAATSAVNQRRTPMSGPTATAKAASASPEGIVDGREVQSAAWQGATQARPAPGAALFVPAEPQKIPSLESAARGAGRAGGGTEGPALRKKRPRGAFQPWTRDRSGHRMRKKCRGRRWQCECRGGRNRAPLPTEFPATESSRPTRPVRLG